MHFSMLLVFLTGTFCTTGTFPGTLGVFQGSGYEKLKKKKKLCSKMLGSIQTKKKKKKHELKDTEK